MSVSATERDPAEDLAGDGLTEGNSIQRLAVVATLIAVPIGAIGLVDPQSSTWPAVGCFGAAISLWLAAMMRRHSVGSRLGPVPTYSAVFLMTAAVGPALWTLSPLTLPGEYSAGSSAAGALLITCVAFVSSVFVSTVFASEPDMRPPLLGSRQLTIPGAAPLVVLGMVGLWMRFPSVASIQGYFSADYAELALSAEGWTGLLSSILRPLLPAGFFIVWCNRRSMPWAVILLLSAVVSLGSFSLNRAYVIVPLVAFVIVYHTSVRPLSRRTLVALGALVAIGFMVTGAIRTTTLNSQGGRYTVEDPFAEGPLVTTAHTIQLYAQAPLQNGLVLEAEGGASPSSLHNSLRAPIPGTSDLARQHTGTREYNRLIYGNRPTNDQVLPSHLESYWTMGAGGLIGWVLVIGLLLGTLSKRLSETADLPKRLVLTVAALWLAQAQIVSWSVLVQVTIYLTPAGLAVILLSRRVTVR